MKFTAHYLNDRKERSELINQIGWGKAILKKTVDRGHWHGDELHVITDTGIIIFINPRTEEILSAIIARPAQISRYYEDGKAPEAVLRLAREHVRMGYNLV